MLLNKKLISLSSILLQFIIFLLFLSAKFPIQAQTNDIVVGIGNKGNVTIRILGPTSTPAMPIGCISDNMCPPNQRCDLTSRSCVNYISPTPIPGSCIISTPMPTDAQSPGCTSDAMCRFDQYCNLTTRTCSDVLCQVPNCKNLIICNHQCQSINEANGTICVDSTNNFGTCQNGNCIVSSPTPTRIISPPTSTPTPRTCIFSTPVPTNAQSPGCTSDAMCRFDQICDLTSHICVDMSCPPPPNCKNFIICNHQCQLSNITDGSFCIDNNNYYGVCQSGNCLVHGPHPTLPSVSPTGCTSDSQCLSSQKCDLTTRTCVDRISSTPIPTGTGGGGDIIVSIGNKQRVTILIQGTTSPTPTGIISPPTSTPTPILTRTPSATPPSNTQPPTPRTTGVLTKITLNAAADATVDEKRPDTNFGRRPILEVDGDYSKQVFMKFDISNLVGKQIKSAKLNIRVANFAKANFSIRFVDDSGWTEDKITYNTRPATGDIMGTIGSQGLFGSWLSSNLDAKELSTEDKNLSIEIESPGTLPFHLFGKDSNFPPQLIVEYVK